MKTRTITLLLLVALLVGCAERNPTIPVSESEFNRLGSKTTLGQARAIWVDDDRAFVAEDQRGVIIYDISIPASPFIVDTLTSDANFPLRDVIFAPMNKLVFVYESPEYIRAFRRLPDGYDQVLSIQERGISDFTLVELAKDTIFFSMTEDQGFKNYDLTLDTTGGNKWWTVTFKGVLAQLNYEGLALDLDQRTAVLARDQHGIEITEIPLGFGVPLVVGSVDTPGAAQKVVTNDTKTHAFVADMHMGIQIVDVTDPQNPIIVSSVQPERADQVNFVFYRNELLYFIDRYSGFYAADVSDPVNPVLLGHYDTPDPQALFVTEDETIYLADAEQGLLILELAE